MIAKKPLKCEHINKEECFKRGDKECPMTVVECDEEKQSHCFVVWNHDNVTGANLVLF